MIPRRILFLLFLVIMTVCGHAQTTVGKKGSFQIQCDISRFLGDTSKVYVELYYGIRENMLTYRFDAGKYSASLYMNMTVRSPSATVLNKEWMIPHTIDDTAHLETSQTLMGLQSFGLVPGSYTVSISFYDVNDRSRSDSVVFPQIIDRIPENHEALSDVELCTSIQSSSDKKLIFYKNTMEVIPNAGKMYGIGLPILYYYVEAYNLKKDSSSKQNVIVRTSVIDATGKELFNKEKIRPRVHDASVEIGTMNLSGVHSGTYIFQAALVDSTQGTLVTSSKKFFVYKPGSVADSTVSEHFNDVVSSEFSVMNDVDVDLAYQQARYIATPAERDQYAKLNDLKGRQSFLFDFWNRRNPNPGSPVNEFKKNYDSRVEYANRNFSVGNREGWKTDRGRVYIIYGPYDDIERNPSSSESLPYEIWHYNNIQGGVIFAFVDKSGFDDYVLVHSTDRDELSDENWYEEYAHRAQ